MRVGMRKMFSAGFCLSKGIQKNCFGLLQPYIMKRNSSSEAWDFKTLKVTRPREFVVNVELNRPEKRNAMSSELWRELGVCFSQLATDAECRAVVLSGAGKLYTAGLDLTDSDLKLQEIALSDEDVGRKAFVLRQKIALFQESFTAIEKCPKPVIAAIHSACLGGGVSMVTACDIRYCTSDAWFSIKEIDLGLAADVGALQRLSKIIGNESLARELAFTARKFFADEAKETGFVSRIFPDRDQLIEGALDLASTIATKSPIAVQGTKVNMIYSRDHSVADSLNYMATWNQVMLQSEDVKNAFMANIQKQKPVFSKL